MSNIRTHVDKERWTKLCETCTSKQIAVNHHIGRTRQAKLAEEFGVRPSMRCVYCGLQPAEHFKRSTARICNDCVDLPKPPAKNCMTDWTKEQFIYQRDKELSQTPLWRATDGPLSYWVRQEVEFAV